MEIVYLIEDGETSGPFTAHELREEMDLGELDPNTYAFTEGMPDWRTLIETLVWAEARTMQITVADIRQAVEDCERARINDSTARFNVIERLRQRGYWPRDEENNTIGIIVGLNVSVRQARKAALQGMAPGTIDAFPAAEAYVLQQPSSARDWEAAWLKAGGQLYEGRFIARKDGPVWMAFGDFGLGHPPFGIDDCLSVRDISRTEALRLGVILTQDQVAPLAMPDGPVYLLTTD